MKKATLVSLLLCLSLLLTGCGSGDKAPAENTATTGAAPAVTGAAPATQNTAAAAPTKDPFAREVYNGPPSAIDPSAVHYLRIAPFAVPSVVQWDLGRASATMAYAQLYTMLTSPETYVGQSVKVQGKYAPQLDENGNAKYHIISVYDSAACCELGVEFLWSGSHAWPNDYPAPGSLIELSGLFDICNDGGAKFTCLRVNDVSVIQSAVPPPAAP